MRQFLGYSTGEQRRLIGESSSQATCGRGRSSDTRPACSRSTVVDQIVPTCAWYLAGRRSYQFSPPPPSGSLPRPRRQIGGNLWLTMDLGSLKPRHRVITDTATHRRTPPPLLASQRSSALLRNTRNNLRCRTKVERSRIPARHLDSKPLHSSSRGTAVSTRNSQKSLHDAIQIGMGYRRGDLEGGGFRCHWM